MNKQLQCEAINQLNTANSSPSLYINHNAKVSAKS